jgi:hypothetical protein
MSYIYRHNRSLDTFAGGLMEIVLAIVVESRAIADNDS